MESTDERTRDDFEFTAAHRLAVTRAHGTGRVVVLDRGPSEPVAPDVPEGERTPAEIEADNAHMARLKREHADWHKLNDEPVPVVMHKIDAAHAVNADPERYILVPPGARAPVTMEERVAKLEQRLGPETPEEIEHRRDRDAEIAKRALHKPAPPPDHPPPEPFAERDQGIPSAYEGD